ncbi:uncharacterized protein CLUP02_07815 [Colletotrichum lupini]|uniref:Uncharacterized protein n=1 Tax=Colletotrichum lupini TaxID=145971 RepID=A0A9Q8WG14_9PEZI|nr:uncharacterized protein CLUP02_07815 [Colletotrichum lupini]UQC82328.1 hypothetical protein CLUP02_07815 [Colletotrichum lupini]
MIHQTRENRHLTSLATLAKALPLRNPPPTPSLPSTINDGVRSKARVLNVRTAHPNYLPSSPSISLNLSVGCPHQTLHRAYNHGHALPDHTTMTPSSPTPFPRPSAKCFVPPTPPILLLTPNTTPAPAPAPGTPTTTTTTLCITDATHTGHTWHISYAVRTALSSLGQFWHSASQPHFLLAALCHPDHALLRGLPLKCVVSCKRVLLTTRRHLRCLNRTAPHNTPRLDGVRGHSSRKASLPMRGVTETDERRNRPSRPTHGHGYGPRDSLVAVDWREERVLMPLTTHHSWWPASYCALHNSARHHDFAKHPTPLVKLSLSQSTGGLVTPTITAANSTPPDEAVAGVDFAVQRDDILGFLGSQGKAFLSPRAATRTQASASTSASTVFVIGGIFPSFGRPPVCVRNPTPARMKTSSSIFSWDPTDALAPAAGTEREQVNSIPRKGRNISNVSGSRRNMSWLLALRLQAVQGKDGPSSMCRQPPPPLAIHDTAHLHVRECARKKKHHEPVVQTAQDPCGLACPASRAMVCGQTELFWGRMPFALNEADDDNEIPYRAQSRCNLSVNMKGPGGGPQVRFRNGPADVFREWHAEAKIDRQQQRYCLSGAQAIRRRTLYRLRAIMWPWNNIKMLQWCGTLRARSMCALRPPEVRRRHSIPWPAIWTGTCCTVPRDIDASTERCIVKVTPRWVGRFPTGRTNHITDILSRLSAAWPSQATQFAPTVSPFSLCAAEGNANDESVCASRLSVQRHAINVSSKRARLALAAEEHAREEMFLRALQLPCPCFVASLPNSSNEGLNLELFGPVTALGTGNPLPLGDGHSLTRLGLHRGRDKLISVFYKGPDPNAPDGSSASLCQSKALQPNGDSFRDDCKRRVFLATGNAQRFPDDDRGHSPVPQPSRYKAVPRPSLAGSNAHSAHRWCSAGNGPSAIMIRNEKRVPFLSHRFTAYGAAHFGPFIGPCAIGCQAKTRLTPADDNLTRASSVGTSKDAMDSNTMDAYSTPNGPTPSLNPVVLRTDGLASSPQLTRNLYYSGSFLGSRSLLCCTFHCYTFLFYSALFRIKTTTSKARRGPAGFSDRLSRVRNIHDYPVNSVDRTRRTGSPGCTLSLPLPHNETSQPLSSSAPTRSGSGGHVAAELTTPSWPPIPTIAFPLVITDHRLALEQSQRFSTGHSAVRIAAASEFQPQKRQARQPLCEMMLAHIRQGTNRSNFLKLYHGPLSHFSLFPAAAKEWREKDGKK